MTKIQSIYAFVTMVVGIGVACFFIFRWTDNVQDTDKTVLNWMTKQDSVQVNQEVFHEKVITGIEMNRILIDSALVIGKQNQKAIIANRSTIIKQIKMDTSLTRDEIWEMLRPYLEGTDDLRFNYRWAPYVNDF